MSDWPRPLDGVLFDLDGTLLDSAPGLYAALQACCDEHGISAPAYAPVREVVSRGARAVLRQAFIDADRAIIEAMVPRYLELYAGVMAAHSPPFEGVEALLEALERGGVRWGVVTNKPAFLTDPLLIDLGMAGRAAAVVSGDTLAVKKPDPAPVLHACARAGLEPSHCVFVGDDLRDIQAGRAAGLFTVAAAWGYLDGGDPLDWDADVVAATPEALAEMLVARIAA